VAALEGLTSSIEAVAQEFQDRVVDGSLLWTSEEFENEKRTVLQEYSDCFNEQMLGTVLNTLRRYYNYFNPIGLSGDLLKFTYGDSLREAHKLEVPSKALQIGVDVPYVVTGESKALKSSLVRFGNYDTPIERVAKGSKVMVGLVGSELISDELRPRVELLLACLDDGLESPLKQEIREKRGLSYSSAGFLSPIQGGSVAMFFGMTGKKEKRELRKVYREFFSGDLSRHISCERFLDCLGTREIGKKEREILPYEGGDDMLLGYDPYSSLESFGYGEAMSLLTRVFSYDRFVEFEY
jgi:hypothetical protein